MSTFACLAVLATSCLVFLSLRAEARVEDRALVSSALTTCCPPKKRSCCQRAMETDRPLKCGFDQSTAVNVTSCLELELWGPTAYNHKLANCCILLPDWKSCRLSCFNKFNSPSIEQFDKLKYMEDCPRRDEETANDFICFVRCAHKNANRLHFQKTADCQFPNNHPVVWGEELGKRML